MAEPVGLVLGALGLAGMYSTCTQLLDHIDSARNLEKIANPLYARLAATTHLLRDWGDKNGMKDGVLCDPHHPAFDNPSASHAIYFLLANIEDMMADQKRLSERYGMITDPPASNEPITMGIIKARMSQMSLNSSPVSWKLRARWAVTDKLKFSRLIGELEVIVDRLYTLAAPNQEPASKETVLKLEELKSRIDKESLIVINRIEETAAHQRDIIARLDSVERVKVLEWLKPVYTVDEYHEAKDERTPGTCSWVLHREFFHTWSQSIISSEHSKFLWIHGRAGFGKTFISAKIVEHFETCSSHRLAYFFCVHDNDAKRRPVSILRSFIAQLATQHTEAMLEVEGFRKGKEVRSPSSSELWSLFRAILSKVPFCRFIIDGFDECLTEELECRAHFDGARSRFLQRLLEEISLSPSASLLIVSRDEADIREGLDWTDQSRHTSPIVEYEIREDDTRFDMLSFAGDITCKALLPHTEAVRGEIVSELCSKAQGMFLWVRLEQGRLTSAQTVDQVRETISSMPGGIDRLDQTYKRSLHAISKHQEPSARERAMNILRWTLYAIRPLTIRELLAALAIHSDLQEVPSYTFPATIDEKYIQHSLLALCGSLIAARATEKSLSVDGSSTIHLAHFSVKEYLLSQSTHTISPFECLKNPPTNHGILAKSCLTYLLMRQFRDVSPIMSKKEFHAMQENFTFLNYAVEPWATHAVLQPDQEGCLQEALRLFGFSDAVGNWQFWAKFYHEVPAVWWFRGFLEGGEPLMYCAFLGLDGILEAILLSGVSDINGEGRYGQTVLEAACEGGHEMTVQSLLRHGVYVKPTPNTYNDKSALQNAAEHGYEAIVKLLLESEFHRGSNFQAFIDADDRNGRTALILASSEGHFGIVMELLNYGADIEGGSGRWTALSDAAKAGHERIVHLLLERGADIKGRGAWDETALILAVQRSGNEDIVRFLLESGAAENINDCSAPLSTGIDYPVVCALHAAAANGCSGIVKILLEAGADIDTPRGFYGNPLQAALEGFANGFTYLDKAGLIETVIVLLNRGVSVNAVGGSYGSALQAAAFEGVEEVFRLLVGKGAKVNSEGGFYGSPLQAAAAGGHWSIVRLLLEEGADINAQGGHYGNALQAAASTGDEEIVKLLMAAGADINAQGGHYGNSLQAALGNGHESLAQWLIINGANVNASGHFGGNLQAAIAGGLTEFARSLVESGADINALGGYYGSALQAASIRKAGGRDPTLVQFLIDKGADVNAPGGHYSHPLCAAAYLGDEDTVRLLVDAGANINARGHYGNALQCASRRGQEELVQWLIDRGADVHEQRGFYGSALQEASQNGHTYIEQILINAGGLQRRRANKPR